MREALENARKLVRQGEITSSVLRAAMVAMIKAVPGSKVDYVEIVNDETLERVDLIEDRVLIALAVKIGSTRLIDNIVLDA